MGTAYSEKSLEYQLERFQHEIVQRLTDKLHQGVGIESAERKEQKSDWEAHLSLYYQHFTQALLYSNPQIFLDFLSWHERFRKAVV